MRSILHLLTSNPRKVAEWQRIFDRYGIQVVRADPGSPVELLLRVADPGTRVVAVCREESDLYRRGTRERSAREHLELVDNVTDVTVHFLDEDAPRSERYEHVTEGFIDRSNGAAEGPGGWWDAIFRLNGTLLTYEELRRLGFKHSSRDMAISRFIMDRVYYRKRVDLRFHQQSPGRTVAFDDGVATFVASNHLLQNPWARRFGLTRAFERVVDGGVFFRAAKNRREKIYWWPGLNAGIPFTPKKDEIHELTYLVHDLCHFLVPDLIFTGNASDAHRRTYVVARMMSEAVTLVLADMVFIESLRRSGHEYDWTKRRIHPLYAELGIDLAACADDPATFLARLRELLLANVAYCIRGDDGPYRRLVKSASPLEAFREKYAAFFVEDYRWTQRNWENLASRADELARWWPIVEPLRREGLDLETVDEVARETDGDPDAIFERIWERRVRPALAEPSPRATPERRRARAFLRWAMGQLGIFARYFFVPETNVYLDRILELLLDRGLEVTESEVARVRAFYEQYVELLARRNLLTLDDAATFQELFPLFEPFYVFYDAAPETYEDLRSVAARALSRSDQNRRSSP